MDYNEHRNAWGGACMRAKTCRECGAAFWGGPRAWYCPACRTERARKHEAEYRARMRAGQARPLGSIDMCERCGQQYEVRGSNQRYCSTCGGVVARENDRRKGLRRYYALRDKINPVRNAARRVPPRVCRVCGHVYEARTRSRTCSPACQAEYERARSRSYMAGRAGLAKAARDRERRSRPKRRGSV